MLHNYTYIQYNNSIVSLLYKYCIHYSTAQLYLLTKMYTIFPYYIYFYIERRLKTQVQGDSLIYSNGMSIGWRRYRDYNFTENLLFWDLL